MVYTETNHDQFFTASEAQCFNTTLLSLSYDSTSIPCCLSCVMSDIDIAPQFLALPFDWYILVRIPPTLSHLAKIEPLSQEKWHDSDPLDESAERRQTDIQLGIAYAALGYEGRRIITESPCWTPRSDLMASPALRSESV